jgi:hypothetical protein
MKYMFSSKLAQAQTLNRLLYLRYATTGIDPRSLPKAILSMMELSAIFKVPQFTLEWQLRKHLKSLK